MTGAYYAEGALSVRFYDAVTSIDSSIRGDIDFYAGLLGGPGRQVLEIGCGTGRVAIALALRGHSVLGVDLSEPMLKIARAKSRSLTLPPAAGIGFLHQDMLKLDLPMRFDLVLLPYYTFNHLRTAQQRARCLSVVARHLLDGATAVIHTPAPEHLTARRPERQKTIRLAAGLKPDDPTPRLEVTWRASELFEKEQRLTQVVEYELFSADGLSTARSTEELNLWWFADSELTASARKAGLKLERTLTGFLPEGGHERIYVLRKAA
ncbi:MAG TPA: class I SAM-dependent methyltransferase [Bauldia sp.]|nr:class I SAM-dependent methyltransferase [Bauldia sp.]